MVTMELDAMMPALNDKKIDAMAAGMTITEKHKKTLAFTDRIRSSGKQFVSCTPDKFPDTSPEALKAASGTQAGTSNADFFQANYAGSDIRLYKSMDEAFQDLGSGRIELAGADRRRLWLHANSGGQGLPVRRRPAGGSQILRHRRGPGAAPGRYRVGRIQCRAQEDP